MVAMIELIKFAVLLNLAVVSSFRLLMFNNMNEDDILPKLTQIVNDKDESIEYHNHISVRNGRKDLRDVINKLKRKKLIKTILPHGQEVHFENSKVVYNPVVRVHHKTPIFIKDNDDYGTKFNSVIEKLSDKNTEWFWDDLKSVILKEENPKPVDNKFNKHIKVFDDQLRFQDSEEYDVDANFNSREFGNKKRSIIPNEYLRQRSGEENDPLAPGKIPFNIDLQEEVTKKPSEWQPSYSLWNYWTYDKTLHQDACKEGLVRYGDKCIGFLPH